MQLFTAAIIAINNYWDEIEADNSDVTFDRTDFSEWTAATKAEVLEEFGSIEQFEYACCGINEFEGDIYVYMHP